MLLTQWSKHRKTRLLGIVVLCFCWVTLVANAQNVLRSSHHPKGLQEASISGTLLMLDDKTPHVAVPVQVIRNGERVATTLSNEKGEYHFTSLQSGRSDGRSHYDRCLLP